MLFNSSKTGMSLLETMVILAIFSLIVGLAASQFRPDVRRVDHRITASKTSQIIIALRNDAIRSNRQLQLGFEVIANRLGTRSALPCDAEQSDTFYFYSDGTINAPDICLSDNHQFRISIDWLTGRARLTPETEP